MFLPLNIRTHFSLGDSLVTSDNLIKPLLDSGCTACAIADEDLSGAAEFSFTLQKHGIQSITGLNLDSLNLYAVNENGWKNLIMISSSRQQDGFDLANMVVEDILAVQTANQDISLENIKNHASLFQGRFYIGFGTDEAHNARADAIAQQLALPILYAPAIRMISKNDVNALETISAVIDSTFVNQPDRRKAYATESYEYVSLDWNNQRADVKTNTNNFAKRCFKGFEVKNPVLPVFANKNENELLLSEAKAGLENRLSQNADNLFADVPDYQKRLQQELDIITDMDFSGYFLIVADFIAWARDNDIPVGPGRGSGAGSLVAWSLGITDIDPVRYGLLFERFLNPDRISMPDFDIDFSQERRGEVIQYVKNRYGADKVAHIGTFGTLKARMAVRDTGRVLQLPYPVVDRLASLIPENPTHPVTLSEAMESEPLASEIKKADSDIKMMFELACKIEGLLRNKSTHAAGIVIANQDIKNIVPVYTDNNNETVTQFDMKMVEKAGLVKFDFLGLKTLDVIHNTKKLAAENGIQLSSAHNDMENTAVYENLKNAMAYGVFQLESAGMAQAMRQIQPDTIDDIVALVSLYRPGPMDNIPVYANVKAGKEKPDYIHPLLEPILKETFGVPVYQEQIMQIARNIAGYSLAQADLLRRAMGKKIASEMESQKEIFLHGAVKNCVPVDSAEQIWAMMERFAEYGFNKSHAAAYAVISWETAWLKHQAKNSFFAALMNIDLGKMDNLSEIIEQARIENINVLRPDINQSVAVFKPTGLDSISFGLAGLRAVGIQDASKIVEERKKNGSFTSWGNFLERCHSIGKRAIASLIKSGATDVFGGTRRDKFDKLDSALKDARNTVKANQVDLFAAIAMPETRVLPEWSNLKKMTLEFDALGLFMTGHVLQKRDDRLKKIRLSTAPEGIVDLNAFVTRVEVKRTRDGDSMAFVRLVDRTGYAEASIFPDDWKNLSGTIRKGMKVKLSGYIKNKFGQKSLSVNEAVAA